MPVPPINSSQPANVPNPSQDAQNQVNLIESYLSELQALALDQAQGTDESSAMKTIYQELEGATAALAQDGKSGTGLSADSQSLINSFENLQIPNPSTPLPQFLMELNQSAGYISVLNDTLKQPPSTPATNPQLLNAQVQTATLSYVATTIQDLLSLKPPATQTYFQDQIIALGLSLTNQLSMDKGALTTQQNDFVSQITTLMNDMAANCQAGKFNTDNIQSELTDLSPLIEDLQSSFG
ncbi:MAG TPA: hypothetical protein VIJ14_02395 [Rhabdochlamydiaceae bacterium]